MKPIRRVFISGHNDPGLNESFIRGGFTIVGSSAEAEAVVTVGGDGTILRTMDELLGSGVPVLAVNSGHLGFLADCERSSVRDSMECLLTGDYMIDHLPVLKTTGPRGKKVRALNEICINRCAEGGILHIRVSVDDRQVALMASDGVLVSTPSGSTAYNLSCGGPVLYPDLPVVIITSICPHLLAIRPIVVPLTADIEFTVLRARGKDPLIIADGRAECGPIAQGESITVSASELKSPVIRTGKRADYFSTLGRKLGWGFRG